MAEELCGPLLAGALWVFGAALGFPRTSGRVLAFSATLHRHAAQRGFLACGAFNARAHLVGFSYGYASQPGLWWREQITPHLTDAQRRDWLTDAFELAELHVHPVAQGRGLGGSLHDTLLAQQTHPRALLSVMQRSHTARRLYASRGWQPLVPEMRFPTEPHEPFSILGWQRLTSDPAVR